MEMSEPTEYQPKPEFDQSRPYEIFSYAYKKQQWIQKNLKLEERIHHENVLDEIDVLIDELEFIRIKTFEGEAPLLNVTARDVFYTPPNPSTSGDTYRHIIENDQLPLTGDAGVFNEHSLQGELAGFHRGVNKDVRVYMSIGDEERRLMGGIYIPLLSIGLTSASFEFVKHGAVEKIHKLENYVENELSNHSTYITSLTKQVTDTLANSNLSAAKKLQDVSPVIPAIAKQPEVPTQFVDALMDIICLKQELYLPHDIKADIHRITDTKSQIRSHKVLGKAEFENVVPQMGLAGETGNRWLGLFFMKDEKTIQIPVQYITNIYKSK